MKHLKPGIFARLVITFFGGLLFIYAIMVWLIFSNTSSSQSIFLESRASQAAAYAENLGNQLDLSYNQETALLHNQAVRKLAYGLYASNYEKYQLVLSVERALDDLVALSPLLEDVIVNLPAERIRVSAVDGFLETGYDPTEYEDQEGLGTHLYARDGSLFMRLSYPLSFSLSIDYQPDILIFLRINMQVLQDSLMIFSDETMSGASLLLGTDLAIGHIDQRMIPHIRSEKITSKALDIRFEDQTYLLTAYPVMNYPLRLVLSINNQNLVSILVRDTFLLTTITIIVGVIFLATLLVVRRLIYRPLNKMVDAFKDLQKGLFDVRIYHKANDEFKYLYGAYNDTVIELKQSIDKILEQGRLLNAAELAQFQSQIHPHFLYNSFFTISRMAKSEEYELIYTFVTALARFYRYISQAQQDVVPLQNEIEHMGQYIKIQHIRFGDVITVTEDEAPHRLADCPVPRLILQPLIENAYEHGLKDKREDGHIHVRYGETENMAFIIVEDNGQASDLDIVRAQERLSSTDAHEKSHALYNINQRLKLFFNAQSGVFISKSPLGGFQVMLRFPLDHARQDLTTNIKNVPFTAKNNNDMVLAGRESLANTISEGNNAQQMEVCTLPCDGTGHRLSHAVGTDRACASK